MKKYFVKFKLLFLIFLFFGVFGLVKASWAATITAASCSYADVNYAVNILASRGDTVNVPAGTCTWNNKLDITKAIVLKGAGAGSTFISVNAVPLISYTPESPISNLPVRITGFSFNGNNFSSTNYILNLVNTSIYPQTKLRIDNNRFYNLAATAISTVGMAGVIDNNAFETNGSKIPIRFSGCNASGGKTFYEYYPELIYGANDNTIWIEDNIFDIGTTFIQWIDNQCGNRYSARYNTLSFSAGGSLYGLLDIHGNYNSSYTPYSGFGGEFYGNQFTIEGNDGGWLMGQRGGKTLIFNNNVTSATRWGVGKLREEEADIFSPIINYPDRIQHVYDTYQWGNRVNLTTAMDGWFAGDECCVNCQNATTCFLNESCCYNGSGQPAIQPNKQYWNYASSFNGASGMGCGTLASRPANCTTGAGYWVPDTAIDPAALSCTNLTGWVGKDNAKALSVKGKIGIFYKCISTNTWTSYYTPLTYPHPLRGEATNIAPAAPTGVKVI